MSRYWIPVPPTICAAMHNLMLNFHILNAPLTIKLHDGTQSVVTHICSILHHPILVVNTDVLLIPSFTFNLQSISK